MIEQLAILFDVHIALVLVQTVILPTLLSPCTTAPAFGIWLHSEQFFIDENYSTSTFFIIKHSTFSTKIYGLFVDWHKLSYLLSGF